MAERSPTPRTRRTPPRATARLNSLSLVNTLRLTTVNTAPINLFSGHLAERDPALGYAATNWTVPLLAVHLRQRCRLPVNVHTLRRRLHTAGLRWKRPRFVFAEPAPHVAQKKGRSCGA